MDNASARNMWGDYLDAHLEDAFHEAPKTIHFCDNEVEANTCIKLVLKGIKKATTHSLLGLQNKKERLPKIGDYTVLTDWDGNAKCIIKTTKVTLKPFFSVDDKYAKIEGIGDKSLTHWKKIHWEGFTRELNTFNRSPKESMIVVCQEFENIFDRKNKKSRK